MPSAFLGKGSNFPAHGQMKVKWTSPLLPKGLAADPNPAEQTVALRAVWGKSQLPAVRPSAPPGASGTWMQLSPWP